MAAASALAIPLPRTPEQLYPLVKLTPYALDSGRRAEDLVGTRLADLLPAPDPKAAATLRAFIASDYRLHEVEFVVTRVDGGQRYFLNSVIGTVAGGRLLRV